MNNAELLKCQKCGKSLCYVNVTPKNFLVSQQALDVKLVATCMECSGKNGFYRRNF